MFRNNVPNLYKIGFADGEPTFNGTSYSDLVKNVNKRENRLLNVYQLMCQPRIFPVDEDTVSEDEDQVMQDALAKIEERQELKVKKHKFDTT